MADKKFSDFTDGNEVQVGDTVVGLRAGVNYKFDFPGDGIKDSNGNYLFKYASAGAASVNYLTFTNSAAGSAVISEAAGSDANIDYIIRAKGAGVIQMPANLTLLTQLQVDNITIDGNTISSVGDLNFVPDGTNNVSLGNYTFDADQTVGAGQDDYVMTYDNGTGLVSLEAATGSTSPLTTKGDLFGFTTVDVRLAVGATDGMMLQVSAAEATGLAWSTATYPATTTINQLLYSSSANIVAGLATGNDSVLVTSAGGVPSLATTLPSGLTIPGFATVVGVQNSAYTYSADTGAADAYVITPSPAITVYTDGQQFIMNAVNPNTGASTININGLGLIDIVNTDGSTLLAANIKADGIYYLVIDVGGTKAKLLNPNNAAEAAQPYFNSTFLESPTVTMTYGGGNVTLNLQDASGTDDLTALTSEGALIFDCTPVATVNVTAGTDTVPVQTYVYILVSNLPGSTMTTSTVGWPSAEYIAVATVVTQSATTAAVDGVIKLQAWTDHVKNSIDNGHSSEINFWIRQQNATWFSGVASTTTPVNGGGAGAAGVFSLATTAGVTLQLHQHAYPVFNTGTGSHVYVPNDSSSAYRRVTDLATMLTDASGNSMSNKRYNLVVWGSSCEGVGLGTMFVNLPTDSYNNDQDAIDDINRTTVFTIPKIFKGTGFLIARITARHVASGNTWEVLNIEDLRGIAPSVATGSGVGGLTEIVQDTNPVFGGNVGMGAYRIKDLIACDAADVTKEFEVDCNAATTSTKTTLLSSQTANRSITLPDATDTLAGKATTDVFTNKSVDLTDNTLTGTLTEFNTALASDSFMSLGVAQEYTKTKNFNATTLTSTTNAVAWDLESNQVATHTATENTTLSAPTNQVAGATYILIFVQDSTPRTLAFNAAYMFPGGTAPTVSTGSGAIDILTFVSNGTNMLGTFAQDYS